LTDPAQFSWLKETVYEPDPDTEESDDLWMRYQVLEKMLPYTTAEILEIASATQAADRAAGYKYPSELLDSQDPQDAGPRSARMAQAAESLAYLDGTKRIIEDPARSPRRRLVSAFLRYWVARTRAQFEMRQDRPSDRAAMRTWLGKEMRAAGVRVTHASRAVPMVVRLALLPDEGDRLAVVAADAVRTRTRFGRLRYRFSCWLDRLMLGAEAAPQHDHGFADE